VSAFGLVEVQRQGQRVEDPIGGARQAAAFHAHVVVDRHPGEKGNLLAAQPLHAAVAAIGRKTGLLGLDTGTARAEELADLTPHVNGAHPHTVSLVLHPWGALPIPRTTVTPDRQDPVLASRS
jgi:hypothetical protein